jgi:hypothetical protein
VSVGRHRCAMKPTLYHCPHCKGVFRRRSSKAWIKSYCERAGRDTRLMRVTGVVPLIRAHVATETRYGAKPLRYKRIWFLGAY